MITTTELREKYIRFFTERGHAEIPSASVIPENDPTVLFTTAGMQPLVPYLMGSPHSKGNRLTSVQKCVRTGDIDDIGDDTHLTFFEMLGNWSLGDYFKDQSIRWSWEFLTSAEWLGIDPAKLSVTYFKGDEHTPEDTKTKEIWKSLGLSESRITPLGAEDNWWPTTDVAGPCGPDTEIFYWRGEYPPSEDSHPGNDDTWVEIWNNVFMQYNRKVDMSLEDLPRQNVDTGMGLERTTAILNGYASVYDIPEFKRLCDHIDSISEHAEKKHTRIIADHMRAATMIIGDERGIGPSNLGQGYVVRKLIRRAVRSGFKNDISGVFTPKIAEIVIDLHANAYPELKTNAHRIMSELETEEVKFAQTIAKAETEAEKIRAKTDSGVISGEDAFYLYESFGLPLELTREMTGLEVDIDGFEKAEKAHKKLSKQSATFKGGLADTSDQTVRLHTATHLLHQALRHVLGDHVEQKGSNITPERLRFDFSHPEKITPEQIKKVEEIVNRQIELNIPIVCETMSADEAKSKGAVGLFTDTYARVDGGLSVYFIGDFSKEICGGPHANSTGELGSFKILKEESSSAGVRRIKAVIHPDER